MTQAPKPTAYSQAARLPKARRRLRLGVVGGGGGGFIGPVHALAGRIDNRYELVAGALSSKPDVAREAGAEWFLDPDRAYADWREMARAEAARPDGIEVVAVTTPNFTHYDIARTFLDAGFHVICDKPMTTTLRDAQALAEAVRASDRVFVVTHGFAAYPMARQARAMIAAGMIGEVRLVHVEFLGDWLTDPIDIDGDPHAAWRTDPARSGPGGCVADIGTHAFHMARFVSGLEVTGISAQLTTFVPGRRLDDHSDMLLRFENGARGSLLAAQVAPGNPAGIRFRIYGSKGGLEWDQDDANNLRHIPHGEPARILNRGEPGLLPEAQRMTRVPRGHPEGYLEAFGNVYAEAAALIEARARGEDLDVLCAGVEDGLSGVALVETAVQSSREDGRWLDPRPEAALARAGLSRAKAEA